MATITYPNKAVAGFGRPDVAPARFIEFEVDFSKVNAVIADDIVIGKVSAGSVILATQTQVLVPGTASATVLPKVSGTSVGTAVAIDAAAGTITSVTTPVGVTASGDILLTVDGADPTSGKFRVVMLVSEMVKSAYPVVVKRDQSA